jgi:hypothetical protein
MDRFRAIAAAVVFALFVVFGYFLVKEADSADAVSWERWVYVFGAAEAIAFTAIGWIFGREVNRERAEKAEEKVGGAQSEAQQEAKKGSILAGMVRGAAGGRPGIETMGATDNPNLAAAVQYAASNYGA